MYGWLFRSLPGTLWVRILLSMVLVAAALLLLLNVVFPWASQFNPFTDSTIGPKP